jgi:1,5-anhydro-D-fructose reductase (1,5-anhydro-D-mannitol-forming)
MIRIGIVGCGRIMAAHLRGYRLLREAGVDDFRITALCSLPVEEAQMYARRGAGPAQRAAVSNFADDPLAVADEYVSDFQDDVDVRCYGDYRQMLAEAPLDAVNDFTPLALHHQVGLAALGAGKHLLTEKPMAVTIRAAQRMCELAEARGLVLGVFQSGRFAARTRHLRWLFDSGRCGRLQMVLVGSIAARWAPDMIVADTPWRHRRNEAGGISLDVGVHRFDMIRYLAGELQSMQARTAVIEPVRVTRDAAGNVTSRVECDAEDTVYAAFDTAAGATGALVASWAGCGGPTLLGTGDVFYGSQGRVLGPDVMFADGSSANLARLYEEHCDPARKAKDFPLGLSDTFALTHYDWLDAVRHGRAPETSGREGLADLACAYSVLESAQTGRRVAIADVAAGREREYQTPIDERFHIA